VTKTSKPRDGDIVRLDWGDFFQEIDLENDTPMTKEDADLIDELIKSESLASEKRKAKGLSQPKFPKTKARASARLLDKFLLAKSQMGYESAVSRLNKERGKLEFMKAQLYLGSKDEIKRLNSVTLDSLRALPKGIGIYIVMGREDEILYVGATWKQGLFLRWANGHHRIPDIHAYQENHGVVCRIYFQEFEEDITEDHVRTVERLMQEIHRPLWNDTPISKGAPTTGGSESAPRYGEAQDALDTARAIVSEYFRPSFCQTLSPQDVGVLALEIGLRLVRAQNIEQHQTQQNTNGFTTFSARRDS